MMLSTPKLTREERLLKGKNHIFSLGLNDGASSLSQMNLRYGLAKLHFAQSELGIESNACFISTPDETVTRNVSRWNSGYGYGGKLIWNTDKNDPLIFVDVKPNACGMIVGGLHEMPNPDILIQNIKDCVEENIYIDNVKLSWDFHQGNHFIDIFKISKQGSDPNLVDKLPPYIFIIHGSVPELRKKSRFNNMGLYYDSSPRLKEICKTLSTPFGDILYLDGGDAKDYLDLCNYSSLFAQKKRELIARRIFSEEISIISNTMHQGLISYSEMLIGCQTWTKNTKKDTLFPVTLRSDLPAFLMSIKPSLSDEIIESRGFKKRAKSNNTLKFLENFDCIPHGGGYNHPHILRVNYIQEISENERFFICEQKNEESLYILSNIREMQFSYRGKEIIKAIEEAQLGKLRVKLIPKYILKF
jgi:hypothetical protein